MPTFASFAPTSEAVPVASSSLLAITPPAVTKVLSQAYPFISAADRILGLVTWTDDDPYKSFLMVVSWCFFVRYFDVYVRYFGHIGAAVCCTLVISGRRRKVEEHPSLDVIIQRMASLSQRANLLVEPLTSLNLSKTDITRFLFAAVFMTPLYILVAWYLTAPTIVTLVGVILLTWHSLWARVTRSILWRWKIVRILVFYTTGIDFSRARAQPTPNAPVAPTSVTSASAKFTYVLYENQRCWLGIGWTSNMLSYERSPWTDEFLNESSSPEVFQLPDSQGTGLSWRWVDKSWRVDLSNDGALAPRSKVRFTPDPGESDGYVYFDNLWKKPTAEPTYSKYTRRRRWVRTAELVSDQTGDRFDQSPDQSFDQSFDQSTSTSPESTKSPDQSIDQLVDKSVDKSVDDNSTIETKTLDIKHQEGSSSVEATNQVRKRTN